MNHYYSKPHLHLSVIARAVSLSHSARRLGDDLSYNSPPSGPSQDNLKGETKARLDGFLCELPFSLTDRSILKS